MEMHPYKSVAFFTYRHILFISNLLLLASSLPVLFCGFPVGNLLFIKFSGKKYPDNRYINKELANGYSAVEKARSPKYDVTNKFKLPS